MEINFNALIPEFCVADTALSLRFYETLGFTVLYQREEEGFVFLEREGAQLMLDKVAPDSWITAPFEKPLGRGVNLQIRVSDVDALYATAGQAGLVMFRPLYEKWYRVEDTQRGNRQFLIQDPDGYLLRFYQNLGERQLRRAF